MEDEEVVMSMDVGIRPSSIIPVEQRQRRYEVRHPREEAEVARRLEIYIRQFQARGRFNYEPFRREDLS
jgi:hypothetical protein